MKPVIAFLGTGLMGAPMVRRLLGDGFTVRIWNRSSAKMEPLRNDGALIAPSPAEAVEGADIVCLCMTDGNAIEDLLFGSGAMAAAIGDGAILIDFSTTGPTATHRIVDRLAALTPSLRWIDAPVTGGVKGAESGELVILCGGMADDIEAARPVLTPLSQRICHMGPLGSGQAAKLCNQLIVSINVLAMAEALALGREYGLDIGALPDALRGGWADSAPFQIIGSRMAADILDPPIVTVATFAKDLGLAIDNAAALPPLTGRARDIYAAALADGLGEQDAARLLRHVEDEQRTRR